MIFFAGSVGAGQKSQAAGRGPEAQKSSPESMNDEQVTNIPYFTLRDGMSSSLTLNNNGPSLVEVKVTLFNTEGRGHALSPISVQTHSFKQIELRDLVPNEDFDSGNIEVAYTGPPMVVTCQVSVFSLSKRVSFESREQDMMDFMSSNLNGILWLPDYGAEGFLAVTNVATKKVTVQFAAGSDKEAFVLASRETRLLKLNKERDRHVSLATLVKLQHNGMPGDVITTGFVLNLETGYSSSLAMVDSSIAFSNRLAGTHFRFGPSNPSERFPEGTSFRAPLLLANVGSHPVNAHVSVDYTVKEQVPMTPWAADVGQADASTSEAGTARDKFSTLVVKDLTIAPGAVQRTELSEELTRLGVTGPVEEAGLDIVYDAEPGTMIGELTNVDQSGDYSFEVPIKDPSAMNEMMEGIYPWTIENGNQSVLHLKNTTADTVNALMLLDFPDGAIYNPDIITLKPYQSIAIDIQKLKNSKKLDVLKRAFPLGGTHGQVQWRQEIPYSMIGRIERTNPAAGIASSFSCGAICCQNYYESPYLSPGSVTGEVGSSATLTGWVRGQNCYAVPFTNGPYTPNLSSQNTSVATTSGGQVSLVGAGTTNVVAPFYVSDYYWNFDNRCHIEYSWQNAQDKVTVTAPTATITVNFTGTKSSGDNLTFPSNTTCSQTLGLHNCSGPGTWSWSVEVAAGASDDASKWTTTQSYTGRAKGNWKDSQGILHAFDDSLNVPNDNPSSSFVQQPAGQKAIFWIDAPGYRYTRQVGEPIDSLTQVQNFTSTVCSKVVTTACFPVAWYLKLVVTPGAVLDSVNTKAAFGSASTNF
jgi:hypothetical protein